MLVCKKWSYPYFIQHRASGIQYLLERPKKAYIMSIKTKSLIFLVILGIIDVVIPIPILGVILIYIVLQRPPWFRNLVQEIYNTR